jgi:hypothetical protein
VGNSQIAKADQENANDADGEQGLFIIYLHGIFRT